MQLYVVRHGIAVESSDGMPDEWRPLTDKGRRRFRKTARAFGKLDRPLDLILTSPLVRAVQTAEILADEIEHDEVDILPELDPKFGVDAVRSAIATRAGEVECVAVVGHEPQLSSILAALTGVAQEQIDLEKGAIVLLDVAALTNGAGADARWWLKPKGSRKKGLPLREEPAEEEAHAAEEPPEEPRSSKKARRKKERASEGAAARGEDEADVGR